MSAYTPQGAFVVDAKWWEWHKTGGTMWASDRDLAWEEADKRYGAAPPAQGPPEGTASAEPVVPASKIRALSKEWKERSTPAETDADDATLRCASELERLLGC